MSDYNVAGTLPCIYVGGITAKHRLYRMISFTGVSLPAAGADVDCVSTSFPSFHLDANGEEVLDPPTTAYLATPGLAVMVEAGGSFAAGANLQTDASGRAVVATSGKVILRALESAAGAGTVVACVFTSGR